MTDRAVQGRRRASAGFIIGNTVAMLLATMVAAVTLWPVYGNREFVVLVVVAAALGAGIAIVGTVFHWRAWLVSLVTIAVYFLVGVPLAIPGEATQGVVPTLAGLGDLAAATALSWKELVTIVLPVGSYQALLVPALILVLTSTVTGLSIALRARIGELGVLGPIALYVAGIGLGPTVGFAPIETGLALFVVLLFWLLWQRAARRRALLGLSGARQSARTRESKAGRRLNAARGVLSAALITALAIGVGTAAAVAFPVQVPRDVVRARVQQPFDPNDYPSPLSEFRSYLQQGQSDAVMLSVTGLPAGGRLRLAALDSYNGIVYSLDGAANAFTRLPDRLDQSAVAGDPSSIDVTIAGYAGVWVPGTGQLERIRFTGATGTARADAFYYNDGTGTAAVLGGLASGDTYTATAVVPRAPRSLATVTPGTAALPALEALPDSVEEALAGYVRAGDPPGVQLQAMLDGLKADGYVSHGVGADEPVSRSGHGLDRISQLFTDEPMLGDAEQYAVAAALLARRLGFPARVVMGFAPQQPGVSGDGATPVIVHGADVSAWIEVQTASEGWVTIDPTPAVRDVPEKQPDRPQIVSRPQTVVPPLAPSVTEQRDPATPENAPETPPAPLSPLLAFLLTVLTITGWTLLAALVIAGPFLLVIVAKARRRSRRRRTGSTLDRVRGGWREFADTAADFGIDVPVGATRLELAEAVGGEPPVAAAVAVDRAVFAPGRPSDGVADQIWRMVGDLRVALAAGRTRRDRFRALISLRSFARYAGRASVPPVNRGTPSADGVSHPGQDRRMEGAVS
ncbi:transglutaminase domain-containing protein [Cryobacterium zhongshanensis]|uniref:TransglutaminaseTgpA domain-containing protein n=1 Tax=Cryobacterium zhongshanensis TaxID=2928153 RepID=A0AA41QUP0_9MICO|nr:transglutaminase domain-containing protein [Cryobacterium zhongshanensis]MCI4657034.1 transglutaminaseTgpA domain-containing protein [Cryobacterium zhongshanensis]